MAINDQARSHDVTRPRFARDASNTQNAGTAATSGIEEKENGTPRGKPGCRSHSYRSDTASQKSLAGQGEDRQAATKFGVLGQFLVATDRTQAVGILLEASRHADAGPATDT